MKRYLDALLALLASRQFFAAIFTIIGGAFGFSAAWANEQANAALVIGGAVAVIIGHTLAAFSDAPLKKKKE